jgi:ribonuclease HII
MKILGIDESGRGPVVGPMVMCGYLIDEKKLSLLRSTGVKDSKMLSVEQREAMEPELRALACDMILLKISAKEIDKNKSVSNLNKLEISKMQQMINLLNPDKVIIDSPERNTKRFKEKILNNIDNKKVHIIAENFADKNHQPVSAASVVAKVNRDAEIKKLHKKYGDFGTGYPHDEKTVKFLKDWIQKNKEFPDCVRNTWITAQEIVRNKQQRTLRCV